MLRRATCGGGGGRAQAEGQGGIQGEVRRSTPVCDFPTVHEDLGVQALVHQLPAEATSSDHPLLHTQCADLRWHTHVHLGGSLPGVVVLVVSLRRRLSKGLRATAHNLDFHSSKGA